MDPASLVALIGLGGKVVDAGVALARIWRESGDAGVAVGADGSRRELGRRSPAGRLVLAGRAGFGFGDPVPFEGEFVAQDEWARAYLQGDQPVLVVIADQSANSGLDAVVAVVALGLSFEGRLYPGNYQLGAFVFLDEDFLDEDFIDWDQLDGGAIVKFTVAAGEPPFHLQIPIEAVDPSPAEVPTVEPALQATGFLMPGDEDRYVGDLRANVEYQILVSPDNPQADLDLEVCDENDNLVDVDDDPASDAVCLITPRWTGRFTIVVNCYNQPSGYDILVEPAPD
jgi:hypothetical protein